jgi:ABC-2 type transport system permease protein
MSTALRAEWTKLRTSPGTIWLLLAAVALTVAVSAAGAATITCRTAGCGEDPAKVGLIGVQIGQAVVTILAVVAISGEYGTGMIRVSLAAEPRRIVVLATKAIVVTGTVMVTSVVAIAASLLAARLLLPGAGYTAAHGYAPLSLADGAVLRANVGSVLYLCLVALLGLGVATIVRETGAAIGVVLGLLYLAPLLTQAISDPVWRRHVQQAAPTAGLAIQATTGLDALPIGPWPGLGVLAAWALGSLLVAALLLVGRDA